MASDRPPSPPKRTSSGEVPSVKEFLQKLEDEEKEASTPPPILIESPRETKPYPPPIPREEPEEQSPDTEPERQGGK